MVRTWEGCVVPFEDSQVRPQVVVDGVLHRQVRDREWFREPRRKVTFRDMFDFVRYKCDYMGSCE